MSAASRLRWAMSSRVSRYGVPRRLSDSGPFEKPQNRHLKVQTFV